MSTLMTSGDAPTFETAWPRIEPIHGYMVPGQERWLFNAVKALPETATIVEIGSFMGRSTAAMGLACLGTRRKIHAIDTFSGNAGDFIKGQHNVDWEGDSFLPTFVANIERAGIRQFVDIHQGFSGEVGESWSEPIDFLFIDGSHDFEDVIQDFELFYRWLKPGGLVALHDVQPEWEGPYRAWTERIRHELVDPAHFFSLAFGRRPVRYEAFTGRVHVIIPVHNRRDFTRGCLETLRRQTVADRLEITVVDDGSSDGTRQMLQTDYPEVRVIDGDGELWWTGAVAKAIEALRDDFAPGDYFLLVNNDSRVPPETVEVLLRKSFELDRAALAPIAVNAKDSNAISTGWGPGTAPVLNDFERQFSQVYRGGLTVPVKSLFGRCSLYPVETLDKAGNFDPDAFPHYHGDTDFSLRAGREGLRMFVTGSTCIRVIETQDSTGSHFVHRQGPQPLRKVVENMTSTKSIDNLRATWTYMSRHHPRRRYLNTFYAFWTSLSSWYPIFYGLRVKRALAYRLRRALGRVKRAVTA